MATARGAVAILEHPRLSHGPDVLLIHVYHVSAARRLAASWTTLAAGEPNVAVSAVNTFPSASTSSIRTVCRPRGMPSSTMVSLWLERAPPASPVRETTALRVGREALLNAVNDAAPRTVEVSVEYGPRTLTVRRGGRRDRHSARCAGGRGRRRAPGDRGHAGPCPPGRRYPGARERAGPGNDGLVDPAGEGAAAR